MTGDDHDDLSAARGIFNALLIMLAVALVLVVAFFSRDHHAIDPKSALPWLRATGDFR